MSKPRVTERIIEIPGPTDPMTGVTRQTPMVVVSSPGLPSLVANRATRRAAQRGRWVQL